MNKNQKHIIKLSSRQQAKLRDITKKGKHNARVINRARILLQSAKKKSAVAVAEIIGISDRTVERVRSRFSEEGLGAALYDAPRPGQPKKLDDKAEAHLVALACSNPPEGRAYWTLELLQKQMIKDGKVKEISTVALWQRLTERSIKPWRKKMCDLIFLSEAIRKWKYPCGSAFRILRLSSSSNRLVPQ
jgi:transposase